MNEFRLVEECVKNIFVIFTLGLLQDKNVQFVANVPRSNAQKHRLFKRLILVYS